MDFEKELNEMDKKHLKTDCKILHEQIELLLPRLTEKEKEASEFLSMNFESTTNEDCITFLASHSDSIFEKTHNGNFTVIKTSI